MAILNRDQILSANDLKTEIVSCPEWGGEVIIRSLSAAERDQFEQSTVKLRADRSKKGRDAVDLNMTNIRARLVSLTAVDEDGNRLFSETDVESLGAKNAAPVDRCFAVAQRLSGLTDKDVEELEKNLETPRNGDSPSA